MLRHEKHNNGNGGAVFAALLGPMASDPVSPPIGMIVMCKCSYNDFTYDE